MKQHVIYIPGLSDRYDPLRRLGLLFWRRAGTSVTLVPMRWLDPHETYEEKMIRIEQAITRYNDRDTVLVGESAGGAVAIAAMSRYKQKIKRTITVCGMNQGAGVVNPALYEKNHAFREAMREVDRVLPGLTKSDRSKMFTIYSSNDGVIGLKDTLLEDVRSYDVKVPVHTLAIGYVLFVRPNLVISPRWS